MQLTVHIPRPYEAEVKPTIRQDIEIRPKFYFKQGWAPLLPITVTDAKGRERKFMLYVSATNGAVRTTEMREVVPEVDVRGKLGEARDDHTEEEDEDDEATAGTDRDNDEEAETGAVA